MSKGCKKILSIVIAVLMLTAFTFSLTACSTFGFGGMFLDAFLDEIAISMLSGDGISVNILIADAKKLGLEDQPMTLPLPSTDEEQYRKDLASLNDICAMINRIGFSSLNKRQQCDYETVLNYFNKLINSADFYYLDNNYLGTSSGWNAVLPLYLDKIELRCQNDVEQWISLVEQTATAFKEYTEFELQKLQNGYGKADFIYDGIAEQAKSIIGDENAEKHFLQTIFEDKVANCDFLTDEERADYVLEASTAIKEYLLPAYKRLSIEIVTLKSPTNNQNGLHYYNGNGSQAYDIGNAYYTYLFRENASSSDSVSTAYDNFKQAYAKALAEYREYADQLGDVTLEPDMSMESLKRYYDSLAEVYTQDFPALPDSVPTATFVQVPSAMADFYNPASYFKSAIDSDSAPETIYVNPSNAGGYLGFDIISHEGIPGHQLQHAYFKTSGASKLRTILGYTGYAEGWATYAQYYSAKYFDGNEQERLAYRMECKYDELLLYLYNLIDIEINYNGKTVDDLLEIEDYARFGEDALGRIYRYLVEHPAIYASYGYGYYKMQALRNRFAGSDLEFHTAVLTVGPTTYEILAKYL